MIITNIGTCFLWHSPLRNHNCDSLTGARADNNQLEERGAAVPRLDTQYE